MKISFLGPNNAQIVVIDNFYSSSELKAIKSELPGIFEIAKLKVFTNLGVHTDINTGEKYQKSCSIFLDQLYPDNREESKILTINRKLFNDLTLLNRLEKQNLFYKHIKICTSDNTLLNFYGANDYYKPHMDKTIFTAITFFKIEKFTGGDLVFPEQNIRIKASENRMVIFPGCACHEAEKVTSGIRVSMSQFLGYR